MTNNLGSMALQGVSLHPKFIFGVNGQIKQNLYVVEDKRLLYVAGHNVIIYNPEDPQ
jgi:cilia- and flagella-associated protein 57